MMTLVKQLKSFKESLIEILLLVEACLTCFWFWLPVLYCIYLYLQIWLIFCVHPLTILVLPLTLSICLILREEKKAKAFYELNEVKYLNVSHPLGEGPKLEPFKWKVEDSVKEYAKLLKKKQKEEQKDSS